MTSRAGYVAIMGAPNAGKSTLLNRLAGGKISIVSPKVQTTRKRVRGIVMHEGAQLVFVDTPGVFDAKKTFEAKLVAEAWAGAAEADAVLVLIDAVKGLDDEAQALLTAMKKNLRPHIYIALNKVDAVEKPYLLTLATAALTFGVTQEIFFISAERGEGLDPLLAALTKAMPESPPLFPEDQLTDQPMRELAAEITREKLFLLLRQELPYSLHVETESWEEQPNGNAKVHQVIYVEREGQKKIIIGQGGEMLKTVGSRARADIEKACGHPIHLQLFVKVSPEWKSRWQ